MINKIDLIKDFGIYKNFNWASSSNIKPFSHKNLFYGWNYSGKTTLSRVFSSLRDKKIHESFDKGIFKIDTEAGNFDQNNLETFPYELLVFNSDYVKDNLNFSIHRDSVSDSKTIFFEVGDNAKFEKKINNLKTKIEIINDSKLISNLQKNIQEFEIYDQSNSGSFTILSRKIQNEDFLSLITFTKTHLKPIVNNVKNNLDFFIIKDRKQISSLSEIVKTSEPKTELEKIEINLSYPQIIQEANELFNRVPNKTKINKILDKNLNAYSWVKEGQNYHKPKEKCLFCDNTITDERIEYLKKYFNSEASILKENSENIKFLITEEEKKLQTINTPSSVNDFNLGFTDDFKILKKEFEKYLSSYSQHLKYLSSQIDIKTSKHLYSSMKNATPFKIKEFEKTIQKLNDLIIKNNIFSKNFNTEIDLKRTEFKNHLVASFLKREKYTLKEKKFHSSILELKNLKIKIKKIEDEISWNESRKVSDSEGAAQYTAFIQSFLNRTDVEIKLDQTKKFILLRNGENASNLSEGEKTAIAFSHFLVTIKSFESTNKFKNYIVFVDDPISSLDGNHIFQINSLLKETFFYKDSNDELKIKCKQLFLSSHNFEFFNLLKELPINNKKESRYFIERNSSTNFSEIKALPEIFDKYSSEYHYLFKEIADFSILKRPLNSDKLLIMPNVLRRFLEMYTLTKFPSKDTVDRRADKVFTPEISKRICKPFHHFSHLDNIDRIGKQSEFMADIPMSCKTLISHIKRKDKLHYEALMHAITN